MSAVTQVIQDKFQDYLLGKETAQPEILGDVRQQFGLPATERLAIYYNAYRIRLRDAMSDAFGKTHSYLGDDMFHAFCEDYIATYPSQHRNLRWYGAQFPTFLASRLPEHPVVAELAAFEWALGLAFDAEDAPVLVLDDLRSLTEEDWEHLGFACHPSLHFLSMQWNAVAIWLALNEEQDPPAAVKDEAASCWLVWRKDLQAHFRSLASEEQNALQGLMQEHSFSEVCAIAAESNPAITPQIAGWLQTWVADEMLSRIRLPV